MNPNKPTNSSNPTYPMNSTILLTFDVEDWFQVENFKEYIPFSSWPNFELRVEKNVHKILDLLDSIKLTNSTNLSREMQPAPWKCENYSTGSIFHWDPTNSITHSPNNSFTQSSVLSPNISPSICDSKQQHGNTAPQQHFVTQSSALSPSSSVDSPCTMRSAPCSTVRATFFVLGWIAKRLPHLVREIQARGHEVASHGYHHELCKEQSAEDLKSDLRKSKKLLENITGSPVYGYRAPSFSIDHHSLKIIEEAGYFYDSSFNSFKLNKRYGQLKIIGIGHNGISIQISNGVYELPVSNLRIRRRIVPWGGGGYFRVVPFHLFRLGVQSILAGENTYLFYLHPWEIDPNQPRVNGVSRIFKFRHYVNLRRTYIKLSMLLESFKECRFSTCMECLQGAMSQHPAKPNLNEQDERNKPDQPDKSEKPK